MSHDKFILINNMLAGYDAMKTVYRRLQSKNVIVLFDRLKNTESKNPKVLKTKKRKNNDFIKM